MSSDAPFWMDLPNYCGCTLPPGDRGSSGWHMREIKHPDSASRIFEAYERCPAWCSKVGVQIDPKDRRLLMVREETKQTRKVKA